MIRLLSARAAEIFFTLRTPYSVLTHVLGSWLVDDFALIIFDIVVYLALDKLNQVATFALHYVFVSLQGFARKFDHEIVIVLISHRDADLSIKDFHIAVVARAFCVGIRELDSFIKARFADLMSTGLHEH
jgi:hypothetical protein